MSDYLVLKQVKASELPEDQHCFVEARSVFEVDGRWLVDEEIGDVVYVKTDQPAAVGDLHKEALTHLQHLAMLLDRMHYPDRGYADEQSILPIGERMIDNLARLVRQHDMETQQGRGSVTK